MKYPCLIQKQFCKTPVHVHLESEELNNLGAPKYVFDADLMCNFQNKTKTILTAEKKLVQEQKREADEFQEKQSILRDLRVEYFLWQLQYLQANLHAQQAKEIQLNRERESCERSEEVVLCSMRNVEST